MDVSKWSIFCFLDQEFISQINMAGVFGNLGNEAIIITKDDEVYAMGSNACGCLGLSDMRSSIFPRKVDALCNKKVKGFAYGSGPHVLAYTESGELYAWGHNGYCELGSGTTSQQITPSLTTVCSTPKKVIDVACGSHHSMALTSDGEVYAWGQNNCGQVGSGLSSNQNTPRRVNSAISGKKVVGISCGQTSSMALLENGEVYGWGYNGNGQLGLGNSINQLTPCRVTNLHGVVISKIVCGYAHSMALSDIGALYVWGANSYGQLGTGNKTNISAPVQISPELGRFVDIAATHYNHLSVAMTQNYKVYMWGQCRGQSILTPLETPFSSMHDVFACCATPNVMWRPMTVKLDEEESVTESFKNAFDDQETSDLTITVHGKPIYVHKAVLKIRSDYFRTMFQNNWQEEKASELEINQFSYTAFRAYLQFLYTNHVDIPTENALELLDLANAYLDKKLLRHCEHIIKQGITLENAALLYATSITYNADNLQEFCFKFVLNHMTAIVETEAFSTLDELTVKDLIRRAAKHGAFKS